MVGGDRKLTDAGDERAARQAEFDWDPTPEPQVEVERPDPTLRTEESEAPRRSDDDGQ